MINDKEKNDFLYYIAHGLQDGFHTCKLIREALNYKGRIPKSFWLDENKGFYGICGLYQVPKSEIYQLRDELIKSIADAITNQKETSFGTELTTDHYARYFHALAILNVPKNTELVPAIGKNLKYNIAYSLWVLDDGSDQVWNAIDNTMWYTAEALKNDSAEERVSTGLRHKCYYSVAKS